MLTDSTIEYVVFITIQTSPIFSFLTSVLSILLF